MKKVWSNKDTTFTNSWDLATISESNMDGSREMGIGRKEVRIACHVISGTRIDKPRAGDRRGMRRDN